MPNMTTNQFRDIVSPLLNKVFDGLYEKAKPEWSQLFEVENALERAFEEEAQMAGLRAAPFKSEGDPIVYDAGGVAWRVRFQPRVVAMAFALTEEMIEDGSHISLGKTFTEHLARSLLETKEIFHANIFSNAVNGAVVGGDGVSMLSTAHPLWGGGTFSNKLQTPANISEAGIEQLRNQIRTAKDERGKYAPLKPRKLVVHPNQHANAIRILNSTLQSNLSGAAGSNNVNVIASQGYVPEGVMELTRLTNPNAWFLTTDAPRGLIHKVRAKVSRKMEGDFSTGNVRYKARERFDATWVDPRGVYGSEGA